MKLTIELTQTEVDDFMMMLNWEKNHDNLRPELDGIHKVAEKVAQAIAAKEKFAVGQKVRFKDCHIEAARKLALMSERTTIFAYNPQSLVDNEFIVGLVNVTGDECDEIQLCGYPYWIWDDEIEAID